MFVKHCKAKVISPLSASLSASLVASLTASLIVFLVALLLAFLPFNCVAAQERGVGSVTGLPIPRFVTLKSNEVNIRKGPGRQYPIKYIYRRKHYPMKIIREFNGWRQVEDKDGTKGWLMHHLISSGKYVAVVSGGLDSKVDYATHDHEALLFKYPEESSHPVLRMEVGVIAKLIECKADWCQIEIEKIRGWIKSKNLWGC